MFPKPKRMLEAGKQNKEKGYPGASTRRGEHPMQPGDRLEVLASSTIGHTCRVTDSHNGHWQRDGSGIRKSFWNIFPPLIDSEASTYTWCSITHQTIIRFDPRQKLIPGPLDSHASPEICPRKGYIPVTTIAWFCG